MTIPPVFVSFQTTGVTPAVQQINRLNGSLAQTGRISGASAGGFKKMQTNVSNLALGMIGLRGAAGQAMQGLLLMGAGAGPVLAVAAAVTVLVGAYRLLTRESREAKEKQDALTESFIRANENLPGAERAQALKDLARLRDELSRPSTLDPISQGIQAAGDRLGVTGPLSRGNQIKKVAELEKAFEVEAVTRIAAARRQAQKDANARELSDAERHLKTYDQNNENRYNEGLSRLELFYQSRRAIIEEGTDAEAKALEGDLAILKKTPSFTPEDEINKKADILNLEEKIRSVRDEGARKVGALLSEQRLAEKALADARLAFEQQIQAAKGNTLAVAISAIEQEAQKFDQVLVKQGVESAERTKILDGFREVFRQRAEFIKVEEDATRALVQLDRDRLAIQDLAFTGKISQHEADQQIAALEQSRLPALRQMADFAMQFAQAVGDPALIEAARELNSSLDGIAASADLAGQQMAQFRADVDAGLTNDLSDFFSRGITEAKSFGDAIRGLGQSIVQTIQRIVAELLAAQIVRGILGGIGLSGGGPVRGNSTQSGGFAAGGYVSGPGGPTSDSIPARLSNGEYVINARSTRENYALLEAINAQPFRIQARPRHYAMGGLVESMPGASLSATLHASSDPGVILKIVDSNFPVMVQNHRKNIRDTTR